MKTLLSLFNGMSGASVALDLIGAKDYQVYASEVDKYANTVSDTLYPNTIQLGDVTKYKKWELPEIDLAVCGFSCQAYSVAGKRLGLADERGGRLVNAMVEVLYEQQPKNVLLENVPGLLSNDKGKTFKTILRMLNASGYAVDWHIVDAALVSAQRRKRVFIICKRFDDCNYYDFHLSTKNKRDISSKHPTDNNKAVVFDSGLQQPEDRGILLKDIVHEYTACDRAKSLAVTSRVNGATAKRYFEKSMHQMVFNVNPSGKGMNGNVYSSTKDKSNALTTNKGEGQKISVPEKTTDLSKPLSKKELAYMLRGNSKWQAAGNCRLDRYNQYKDKKSFTVTANTSKGVPYNCFFEELKNYIVPFDKTLQILDKEVAKGKVGYFRKDSQANRVYYIHDKAVTLCGDAGGGAAKMGQYLFETTKHNSQGDRVSDINTKSPTLNASSGGTAGKGNALVGVMGCITPDRIDKRQNGQRFSNSTKFYTLTAQDKHGILIEGYIRKLTPTECFRLQSIPEPLIDILINCGISNSQLYKMAGNGFNVEVVAHILKHILKG